MVIENNQLRDILVEPGYINKDDFNLAIKEAKKQEKTVEEVLIEKDLIKDEQLGYLIAENLGLLFIDLKRESIDEKILKIVPELVAKEQQVIVFDKSKDGLKVAMHKPNYEMEKWLEKKTGEKVIVYYATLARIKTALKFYKKNIKEEFSDIIKAQVEQAKKRKTGAEELPIIKIVDLLVEYAYENKASDIHIEPLDKTTQVRFRIDGVLHDVVSLPQNIHDLIIARIKVLSKLRTDVHFSAQDGKFTVKTDEEKFDVRVSILPVTDGENAVMRILSEKARKFNLEDLGFLERDLAKVQESVAKPYGMILATGPTGCGKTTTLYGILKILNKPEVNICTIEDPVEYDIERISQIQVNAKTGLTFAKGLRSIVRQDPDIIMVGEIRDQETAGIAINSAMTGHLVLSTMHANTAATNIPRLMDMGIEPFLVASSINIIIAQRLVRKICSKCRESKEYTKEDLKKLGLSDELIAKSLGKEKKIRVYFGKGCKDCVNTGYSGRIGIFEILEMQDNIKELVMLKAPADQIQSLAVKNGMTTMIEDGLEKVWNGTTTLEEVMRVIRE